MNYGYVWADDGTSRPFKRLSGTLEQRRAELRNAGVDMIFEDFCSLESENKPGLDEMLSKVTSGDVLYVKHLGMFGCDADKVSTMVDQLLVRGVNIRLLDARLTLDSSSKSMLMAALFTAPRDYSNVPEFNEEFYSDDDHE